MRINKKLCITLAAAVIFQASGQCKTLHGGAILKSKLILNIKLEGIAGEQSVSIGDPMTTSPKPISPSTGQLIKEKHLPPTDVRG